MGVETWQVDIGIATKEDVERALTLSAELEEELIDLGLNDTSSGCGFGFRNIQFEALDKATALAAVERAKKFLKNHFEDEEDYYASATRIYYDDEHEEE